VLVLLLSHISSLIARILQGIVFIRRKSRLAKVVSDDVDVLTFWIESIVMEAHLLVKIIPNYPTVNYQDDIENHRSDIGAG